VTISVISILIGILAPAIAGAREAGRRVVCASNIRQIQIANELYAEDHDDRYVAGAPGIADANLHRWHGVRETIGDRFESEQGALTPYLDGSDSSRHVRACPSFVHTLEDLQERGLGFEAGSGGYGYNNSFVGVERTMNQSKNWDLQGDLVGSRRSKFATPTATIAFADSAFAGNELIEYSFVEPRKWPQRPRFRPDPSIHFRHSKLANIAWLDGHVAPERRTAYQSTGLYASDPFALGIGWFGMHDDNRLFDYE
jgi:prepilin-type processing-associated H-X9-DG protein